MKSLLFSVYLDHRTACATPQSGKRKQREDDDSGCVVTDGNSKGSSTPSA